MSFLEWIFLLGAAAVLGPVAAHLLSRPRFRRVPFTMLRFLRSGQRESHARRRLRDLLILLLRCAIIVVLALLFAQPVLHVAPKLQPHRSIHYLAVDDSMSMAYRADGRTVLAQARDAAVAHVASLSANSICHIRGLASRRTFENLDKTQALAALRQPTAAPRNADFEAFLAALRQARRAAAPGDSIHAAVFGDFAPDVLAQLNHVREPAVVDALHYEALSAGDPIDNAAIVDARVTDSDPPGLDVTVANYGAKPQQRTLLVEGPGLSAPALPVSLGPQERRVYHIPLNHQTCLPVELRLSPQDSLAEDDTYRIAVYMSRSAATRLLLVGAGDETFLFETAVRALGPQRYELRKLPEVRLTSGDFDWADVVVLAGPPVSPMCRPDQVEGFLNKGGRLLCFATRGGTSDPARLLVDRGLLPALPEKWVQEVSYPEPAALASQSAGLESDAMQSLVNYHLDKTALKGYWTCRTAAQSQCLWRLTNGAGFVYGRTVGAGLSLLVNTSIDGSGGLLAKSQAWVAFCQCLLGRVARARGCSFSTLEAPMLYFPQPRPVTQMWVENCDGSKVLGQSQGLVLRLPAPTGLGWIRTYDRPPLCAGINLPEGETEIVVPSAQAVADAMKRAFVIEEHRKQDTASVRVGESEKPIWRAFAWAAIGMILLESAWANRLKR